MPPFEFRGNGRGPDRRSHPRQNFTFRYPRPHISERPLLSSQPGSISEQFVGEQEKQAPKFTSWEDLSDSEEAEMDLSTDEDAEETSRPRKKLALGLDGAESPVPAPPAPKWSNPDPYTALPPPDESREKRVDVVKLIRKAKIAASATKPDVTNEVTTNQDFISFGAMGIDDEPPNNAPENAPRGPKGMDMRESALAGRKRTRDDEVKGYSKKTGKPASKFYYDASILDQWRALPQQTPVPWMEHTAPAMNMGTRLHNEIISFYHWAKPQKFEQIVRADLIARLQSAFQNRYRGVQIRAFGSFASGLYLPTADVDLVLLSTSFMSSGRKTFGERKGQIYAFSGFLKNLNIVVPNSIEVIAHARVPILKFVDKLTGLRVDLSFDNDSGLVANETFQMWKAEYPVMPVVISIVKQFLLLRGLNEVPTGGLGGFSITCLVVSLLQHMPHGHVQQNLGNILMDFFNFYGNIFNYERMGISMNPPGYFNKRVFQDKNDRLTIEDPNNRDNDISGGTKEIALILRAFSKAHDVMKNAMIDMSMTGASHTSILQYIIGANYDEYTEQRFQLRQVFETCDRFDHHRSPPPPPPGLPPPDREAPPPPPEPSQRPSADKSVPNGPKAKQTNQQKQGVQNGAGKQAPVKVTPSAPTPAPQTKLPSKGKQSSEQKQGAQNGAGKQAPVKVAPSAPAPAPKMKPSKPSNQQKQTIQTNGAPDPAPAPASKETSSAEAESGSEQDPSALPMTAKAKATYRRNVKCQERADRLRRLRPDLKVRASVSLRQARLLAGYKDNKEMEMDLDEREKQMAPAPSSA
ncbi:hypothetical protein N7510_006036 [Penicillium lagena]|uniref:uncharacterized protein n=1 Tax=Penicillium lagena TaxID=94218 RepID=UPI002540374F|nr:uncharacterized protein N7510_006036 [Penicillium lagena]KAJ5612842.1 hypothetical protein N7510_006036 [Penicillium lagena]